MSESTDNTQITDEVRRRAADYAELTRSQFEGASFDSVDNQLAANWLKQLENQNTSWTAVRGIVQEAWNRRAEVKADAVSNHAGFDSPPTFADAGNAVPRNLDEPNQ